MKNAQAWAFFGFEEKRFLCARFETSLRFLQISGDQNDLGTVDFPFNV
jgi:hypothetical protein